MKNYAELLFVDTVRALQDQDGVGEKFASYYEKRTQETLSDEDRDFISARNSFYLASVSQSGWPYLQHRGGPVGFLKIIGTNRLGFADYRGNRQYLTMGHVAGDDRVALILVDYEDRERLKILGRLTMVPVAAADPDLVRKLTTAGEGKVERITTIEIEAIDWNCPKYIPRLVEAERLEAALSENEALKAEIERLRKS